MAQLHINNYKERRYYLIGGFLLIAIIYLSKLFYMQVVDETYKLASDSNAIKRENDLPPRAFIYDRNGNLLVYNQKSYDLWVYPQKAIGIDTAAFCKILGIDKTVFSIKMTAILKQPYKNKSKLFETQISQAVYLTLQEQMYKFPGFYAKTTSERAYKKPIGSHLFGYISETDKGFLEENPYYKMGDNMGKAGIEKSYEELIRGERGIFNVLVDANGNHKGSYANGIYDTMPISGANLYATIDLDLQEYGEILMQNKLGSIVAIEPKTGEILCLVSAPNYNPNLLVGKNKSKNYRRLLLDPYKPLFNRATSSSYPPGSTFKLLNGLIALQENIITPETKFSCYGGFRGGGLKVGCHRHPSPVDLKFSITTSCNGYYCNVFKATLDSFTTPQIGYEVWRKHMDKFGLGKKLDIDFPQSSRGNIPSKEYFDKRFGVDKWKPLNIISLAIGQGEIGVTPLQMANYCATIANRGYFYTPHVIKKLENSAIDARFKIKNETGIDQKYFELIVDGMVNVVKSGTGRGVALDSITVAGKTGTSQNPHGKDHSVFIAFAPAENPKIAIAVYVENAGFGATWAGPIARCMLEKYLLKKISKPEIEERVKKANLLPVLNNN